MKINSNELNELKNTNKTIKALNLDEDMLEDIGCTYETLSMYTEDSVADFIKCFVAISKAIIKNSVVSDETTKNATTLATIFENVKNSIFEDEDEDSDKLCNKLQNCCELDDIYELEDLLNDLVAFCEENEIQSRRPGKPGQKIKKNAENQLTIL